MIRKILNGIFYVAAFPLILLFWLVDSTLNGKPGGTNKLLGEKLAPGVTFSRRNLSFTITDFNAYFGSIPESKRRRIIASRKYFEKKNSNPS